MDYYVTYKVDARHVVKVNANSLDEARKKAELINQHTNFGELETVETEIVTIEDSDGNYLCEQ